MFSVSVFQKSVITGIKQVLAIMIMLPTGIAANAFVESFIKVANPNVSQP